MTKMFPAVKLYLGDNDIDKDIDYSFIAAVDGTLYVTIKELIVDNYYCSETVISSPALTS